MSVTKEEFDRLYPIMSELLSELTVVVFHSAIDYDGFVYKQRLDYGFDLMVEVDYGKNEVRLDLFDARAIKVGRIITIRDIHRNAWLDNTREYVMWLHAVVNWYLDHRVFTVDKMGHLVPVFTKLDIEDNVMRGYIISTDRSDQKEKVFVRYRGNKVTQLKLQVFDGPVIDFSELCGYRVLCDRTTRVGALRGETLFNQPKRIHVNYNERVVSVLESSIASPPNYLYFYNNILKIIHDIRYYQLGDNVYLLENAYRNTRGYHTSSPIRSFEVIFTGSFLYEDLNETLLKSHREGSMLVHGKIEDVTMKTNKGLFFMTSKVEGEQILWTLHNHELGLEVSRPFHRNRDFGEFARKFYQELIYNGNMSDKESTEQLFLNFDYKG